MVRNIKYTEWLRRVGYKNEGQVALVVLYGSTITNTATPLSDVDCFFVPKTKESVALSETAIIEGIGYDFFPLSWQHLEKIARLELNLTPLLGQCEILYADTLEDVDRFLALQKELEQNLHSDQFVLKAAENSFAQALKFKEEFLKAKSLGRQRRWAGLIINTLADSMAYLNKSYFKRGLKKQPEDLKALKNLPEGFIDSYSKVSEAKNTLTLEKSLKELFRISATAIYPASLKVEFDFHTLAEEGLGKDELSFIEEEIALPPSNEEQKYMLSWYEEAVSAFNKIYGAQEDAYLSFIGGVYLEHNFAQDLSSEFNWPQIDLLQFYDPHDLKPIVAVAKKVQGKLLELINQTKFTLNEYALVDDFLKAKGLSMPEDIEFRDTTNLSDDEIFLRLGSTASLNLTKGFVPAYYFQIVRLRDGMVIGNCDLRVGYNANIELGGNIGYTVYEPYRGRGTAAKACNLLKVLAKEHNMKELILTVRPDNIPSIKTCLNIGAVKTKEIVIPPHHELARNSRIMNQYKLFLDLD